MSPSRRTCMHQVPGLGHRKRHAALRLDCPNEDLCWPTTRITRPGSRCVKLARYTPVFTPAVLATSGTPRPLVVTQLYVPTTPPIKGGHVLMTGGRVLAIDNLVRSFLSAYTPRNSDVQRSAALKFCSVALLQCFSRFVGLAAVQAQPVLPYIACTHNSSCVWTWPSDPLHSSISGVQQFCA